MPRTSTALFAQMISFVLQNLTPPLQVAYVVDVCHAQGCQAAIATRGLTALVKRDVIVKIRLLLGGWLWRLALLGGRLARCGLAFFADLRGCVE